MRQRFIVAALALLAWLVTVLILAGFTALFAATIAFTQRDVKKVLAYSTISQLGFMVSALGMGGQPTDDPRDLARGLHIISVIAWMAGLLYLPRLFVYHCTAEKGSVQSETFKMMERRLLKAIINPAMIITWLAGLTLVWQGGWLGATWFQVKFVLVLAMSALHGFLARWVKDFAADRNTHTEEFYRVVNEIPTVLMIAMLFAFGPQHPQTVDEAIPLDRARDRALDPPHVVAERSASEEREPHAPATARDRREERRLVRRVEDERRDRLPLGERAARVAARERGAERLRDELRPLGRDVATRERDLDILVQTDAMRAHQLVAIVDVERWVIRVEEAVLQVLAVARLAEGDDLALGPDREAGLPDAAARRARGQLRPAVRDRRLSRQCAPGR